MKILLALVLLLPAFTANAQSPAELLKASQAFRADPQGVSWYVKAKATQGNKTVERTLKVEARGGDFIAEFLAPDEAAGEKVVKKGDDAFFIKPTLKRPVTVPLRERLAGAASLQSLAADDPDAYEAQSAAPVEYNGKPALLLKAVAKGRAAGFERAEFTLGTPTPLLHKAVYFTAAGKPVFEMRFSYEHRAERDGKIVPFISRIEVEDRLFKNAGAELAFSRPDFIRLDPARFELWK